MVAAVLAAIAVEKIATDPDAWRTAKMRAALVVESAAMKTAARSAKLADAAARVYQSGCAR